MNDFWKRPSFIAAIIIVISYFILPYYQINSPKDTKKKNKFSISFNGMQLLTGKATFDGKRYEDMKKSKKRELAESFYLKGREKDSKCEDCKSFFGLADKLNILLLVGSALLLFGAFKAANGEEGPLDDNKIRWTKIIMLILAGFLWTRYTFSLETSTLGRPGFGIHLTLLACVFIMFEDYIMAKVNEKVLNKS